jgi:transposase, IS6 family
MMEERGLSIAHITIMRWVHQYGPEMDKRIRRHLRKTNDFWRIDETYIKVKRQWMYLYRAVDSEGNTIDFCLSKTRDQKAAKRFFKKALRSFHVSKLRVITVDNNLAYPVVIEGLQKEKRCQKASK